MQRNKDKNQGQMKSAMELIPQGSKGPLRLDWLFSNTSCSSDTAHIVLIYNFSFRNQSDHDLKIWREQPEPEIFIWNYSH